MLARNLAVVLALTVFSAGCMEASAKCGSSQGYTGQMGVCSTKDAFSYGEQGGPINKSSTYEWQNTKGGAAVSLGSQGTGTIRIVLKDAAGTQVFSKSFSGPGQFGASEHSQHGKTGMWTIELTLTNVNGQAGLAVHAE